jgi:Fe-S cluster assembly iron-binding protein IscA
MLEISQRAIDKIHHIFDERDRHGAIRLMPISGGCAGTHLELFFAEPSENDLRMEKDGISFVMDEDLYKQAVPIFIDYSPNPLASGFRISSAFDGAGECGDCACSC